MTAVGVAVGVAAVRVAEFKDGRSEMLRALLLQSPFHFTEETAACGV